MQPLLRYDLHELRHLSLPGAALGVGDGSQTSNSYAAASSTAAHDSTWQRMMMVRCFLMLPALLFSRLVNQGRGAFGFVLSLCAFCDFVQATKLDGWDTTGAGRRILQKA